MTFELPERDADGWHGFLLPPDNIKRVTLGLLFSWQGSQLYCCLGGKGSLYWVQEDVLLALEGGQEN